MDILLIEDDGPTRKTVDMVMAASGHNVRLAEDFGEGLTAIQQKRPDLIILDLGLPDKSINEVISSIRDLSVEAPIVVLTGSGDELYAVQAFNNGASGYIKKPATADELIQTVEAAKASGEAKKIRQDTTSEVQNIRECFRGLVDGANR